MQRQVSRFQINERIIKEISTSIANEVLSYLSLSEKKVQLSLQILSFWPWILDGFWIH